MGITVKYLAGGTADEAESHKMARRRWTVGTCYECTSQECTWVIEQPRESRTEIDEIISVKI